MYVQWLFLIMVLYSAAAIVLYMINRSVYSSLLQALRKWLYALFLLFLSVCFFFQILSMKDWPLILQLAAAAVFIDLSIFQTPNIQKIGSAEFKHSEWIEQTIQHNERTLEYMRKKSTAFSLIIQEEEDLMPKESSLQSFEDYERSITAYVEIYTDQFDFHVKLYHLVGDDDYHFTQSIHQVLGRLETIFNISINDKQHVTDQLKQARVHSFNEEKVAVIPIYGHYSYLLILSARENSVMEIDTLHVINLVKILEWRTQSKKSEPGSLMAE
ncbi:type II toxin-antitoxin system SpoIISA family toxin [Metabacillus sp. FJAT-52054]|uniref:Type II toxin-antitoxin system SpoIISA family toxin n=1 Tax=Metabacillus sediminis TaxID=3117746 RepID=A0ABZ2NMV6_9BACI